jgi:signal transduction histidine kinase
LALESILKNRITNAIEYTRNGEKTKFTVDIDGINIRIFVTYNGFGMADKYPGKVFERLVRINDNRIRYNKGTPLGLPIVTELVNTMGDFIDTESTLGRRIGFMIILPAILM